MRHSRLVTVCIVCSLFLVLGALPGAASASSARSAAAGSMVAKVNSVRARSGLPPLRRSASLAGSSARFARWLMRRHVLGHRGRVQASGRFRRLGEALALNSGPSLAVGTTVRMWLSSPSHRRVLMTRTMRWVGAGVVRGRFRGRLATIWVLQTGAL
jgi:uncharacterized protein YkwD